MRLITILLVALVLNFCTLQPVYAQHLNIIFVSKCEGTIGWDCFNDSQGAKFEESQKAIARILVETKFKFQTLSAYTMVKDCRMDKAKGKFKRAIRCLKEEGLYVKGAYNVIVVDPSIMYHKSVWEYAGESLGNVAVISVIPGCYRNTKQEVVKHLKQLRRVKL